MDVPIVVFPETQFALQCLLFLLLGGLSAPAIASPKLWGETVNGLEISIYLDQARNADTNLPDFKVALHNAGENDFVLNLGIMLANGKQQYPRAIFLMIADAAGKTRRFDLIEPGFIAGRLDPLVVPLGVGATLSIPVDLHKYWAAKSFEFDYRLKPGTYFIEAQFIGTGASDHNSDMAGVGLMPYWQGTIISNRLQFEVPK
jgi:hypothetical protein